VIQSDRFDLLFRDSLYVELKQHFYSFVRRKKAILSELHHERGVLLEIGAGTCPIVSSASSLIYSDISEEAMRYVKRRQPAKSCTTFSVEQIPFAKESVSTIICSEVLEHIHDDTAALRELARILDKGGTLILTVPLHDYYFAQDDEFVGHRRRYSIGGLMRVLGELGFSDFRIMKVAGPLEKLSTLLAVMIYKLIARRGNTRAPLPRALVRSLLPPFKLLNYFWSALIGLEARLLPVSLTTIALVTSRKS
jgi:SAM-dependent methyltransferase